MANCAQCGRELPAFSLGEASNLCVNCKQMAVASTIPPGSEHSPVVTVRPAPYRPPVTVTILGINLLVFAAMVATGAPLFGTPDTFQLLRWGADQGPLSLDGQPWRILTSNYVHIGMLHLAVNMWALWQLGRLAERIFGGWTYFLVYTASGIAGSLASLWWNPFVVSAGASGALFGIIGALIGALYLGRLSFPKPARQSLLKNLLWVAAINLFLGATIPGIDNAGHVGGLLMGLGLGVALGPQMLEPPERRRTHARIVFVAAAFLLIGFGIYVKQKNGYVAAPSNAASPRPPAN